MEEYPLGSMENMLGGLVKEDFYIPETPYIDFEHVFDIDWLTCTILSGRRMGKTTGFWRAAAKRSFPDWQQVLKGKSMFIFGSIVGNLNDITTSDMQDAWEWWIDQIKPGDEDIAFEVKKRICYIVFSRFNYHKEVDEVIRRIRIGVYAPINNTGIKLARKTGNQKCDYILIEELNPESPNHEFVGTDTSALASVITSIAREPDNIKIIAIGNQQLYPSKVLKYLKWNEKRLGLDGRALRLMLDRPVIEGEENFTSYVATNEEYDSFSKLHIHDISQLKHDTDHYISLFKNDKPYVFFTSYSGSSLIGWTTVYNDTDAVFVTSHIPTDIAERWRTMQAFERSPYEEEVAAYDASIVYIRKMYYEGKLLIANDDRDTYYFLNEVGCLSQDVVKSI